MPNTKITAERARVRLSANFFLNDISYEFSHSQVYALLGESGSGKSTFLRTITGLLPLDSGRIDVNGIEVNESNMKPLSQIMGFMPQNYGLFPHLTVKDNVCLQAKLLGWSSKDLQRRLEEMVDLVRLHKELLPQYPRQLSGGQRQRVALMRCMFLDQPVFLFDEPLSALDMKTKSEILMEWNQLFSQLNKLVLIVTHSLYEAKTLGNQILVMKAGELKESGTYKDLSADPNSLLSKDFISSSNP
ncbi:MAG TPA: ABC transporter ATP-binding protein [Bdellovibrionales bacterium]|nr:ABC transporter ATP-binding protein [Pseudobdellovibrionaceae bacterium]HAG90605.1 ABC transporter ATP-binding protein [Bdellovibrionales bacterium]|tara:strand:+ start:13515 stop:14249 length:735 start_codon:yes stop_codon:yes gene_type:complete